MVPNRPYTAFFTAPMLAFSAKDIFDALLTDGIPASEVCCLQRSPYGNVLITFALKKYRDLFLLRSSFIVRWDHYVTNPGWHRLLFITIYDAPHELPDSVIEYHLGRYGRIFSFSRSKVQASQRMFSPTTPMLTRYWLIYFHLMMMVMTVSSLQLMMTS